MQYAPILIPTLSRSRHFVQLMKSLSKNSWAKHTEVYVAVDYTKDSKFSEGRQEILNYLRTADLSAFSKVNIIERTRNYGAFRNIDSLQNEIAERYDSFISIPDDMIVSPNFIEYMDRCLEEYEEDDDVIAVCGYNWPVEWKVSEGSNCFKQNMTCTVWGTGYWSMKYAKVRQQIESGEMLGKLPDVIANKTYRRMINVCRHEYILAACYRWCYGHQWLMNMSDIGLRAYLAVYNKYAIVPVISKCRNYGFDGSGEYCQGGKDSPDYFVTQKIDIDSVFVIREDKELDLARNCNMLNKFDYRSAQYMSKANRLIWLCEHLGIWSAKLYCNITMPWDFTKRLYNKFLK